MLVYYGYIYCLCIYKVIGIFSLKNSLLKLLIYILMHMEVAKIYRYKP